MPPPSSQSHHSEFDFVRKLNQPVFSLFLNDIVRERTIAMPAVVEIDPTTACNLMCPYCISASCMKRSLSLPLGMIINLLNSLKNGGALAVILIGGGEPLLHPDAGDIINEIVDRGMQLGVTTNGTMLSKFVRQLNRADWVRISLNAASEKTFRMVSPSRNKKTYFQLITKGIEAISRNKTNKVGWSFLILNNSEISNFEDISQAARIAKDVGCDYIEYKPMMERSHEITTYSRKNKIIIKEQLLQAKEFENSNFRVLLSNSQHWLLNYETHDTSIKESSHCYMTSLRTVITPTGCYICPYHRGNEKFNYGILNNKINFDTLWHSSKRKQIIENHDVKTDCPFFCIRKESNRYVDRWLKKGMPVCNHPTNDRFI